MSSLDVSQRVCALVPGLQHWLENAFFAVRAVDAAAPRDRDDRRVLLASEIAHATHRDILINLIDGAPSLVPAANGLPARVAFGLEDMGFAFALIAELARPDAIPAVGDNASARLMTLAGRVARSDATVLIQGDTGTGKEGMARFLHAQSGRVTGDFIAVNCAALPETMMEAMLFGHKKGSFTGAANASEGLFLAADGGTLFLDEIAELPLALQAKLLRALQEGEVLPVGATHPVPVNVRVIAACNRNLADECAAGRFREDLYWRLNVMRWNCARWPSVPATSPPSPPPCCCVIRIWRRTPLSGRLRKRWRSWKIMHGRAMPASWAMSCNGLWCCATARGSTPTTCIWPPRRSRFAVPRRSWCRTSRSACATWRACPSWKPSALRCAKRTATAPPPPASSAFRNAPCAIGWPRCANWPPRKELEDEQHLSH